MATEVKVEGGATTSGVSKELESVQERGVIVTVVNAENGDPIEGITVELGTYSATTNSEGKATIQAPAGTYSGVVNPGAKSYFTEHSLGSVTLVSGQRYESTVSLQPAGIIKGTITNKHTKAAAAGITVTATGHHVVTVKGEVPETALNHVVGTAILDAGLIAAGDSISGSNIPAGTTIKQVFAGDGPYPAPGEHLELSKAATQATGTQTFTITKQQTITATAVTNSEGEYEITGLPTGTYTASFAGDDYEAAEY